MVGKVINGKWITENLELAVLRKFIKHIVHLKTPWALKVIQSTEDCAMNS